MAESRSALNEAYKKKFMEDLTAWLIERGEDVIRVKSNEVAFPFVNAGQNDEWMVITSKVPTGTREGEPYDGYSEGESYQMKIKSDAEKAEANAATKASKIKRDTETRRKQAEAKAKAQAAKEEEEEE